MHYRTIDIDEAGRSLITFLNGDEVSEVGSFGANLEEGDEVELGDDEMEWTVRKVHSYIQTGSPGTGIANFVSVDLER